MYSQQIVEYGKPLQGQNSQTPVPRGSEVLLRVSSAGVCHSDVHLHDGHFDLGGGRKMDVRGNRPLPFTLGHEIEGTVVAVGEAVTGVAIGERRVAYPWIGCGECPACATGDEHLCPKPRNLGIQVAGGFSDHCLVPHPRYLLDYSGIPDGLAATYMCSGLTAFGALKKLGALGPEAPVLIVGAGGVGMMGVQFARALFGGAPLVADVNPAARESAVRLGAGGTYDPRDEDALKQLLKDTGGGAVAAIDFVGSEASTAFAVGAVRRGGTVIIVGLFGGEFRLPIPMFPLRNLTVRGSYVGSLPETIEMMALVRSGAVQPIPLTERPLDAADQTLNDLRQGRVVGRVVLKP